MKRKVIFVVLALVLLLAPMSTLADDTVLATRTVGHYVVTLSTNNAGCYTYAVTDTQKNAVVFSYTFCRK